MAAERQLDGVREGDTAGVVDVVVVGAGPAGLAAAVEAATAGARVVVLDDQPRPGGQYWRQGPAGPGRYHHDRAGWDRLAEGLRGQVAAGRVDHRPDHQVWRLDGPGDGPGDGHRGALVVVHAVTGGRGADGEVPVTLRARAVVVATGAHDRVLPFPGWELPGVLTPGAVQALLKEHGVVAGRRVVVGGSGPFLLPVATALLQAGAQVPALVEAGDGRGWLRGWRGLAAGTDRLGEAAGYAAVLARHRVRPRLRHAVVAAHGNDRVEAVTVARLDAGGAIVPGSGRQVAADTVAVGWGFTARVDLALQAGAVAVPSPDGGTAVAADPFGRTAVPGVLVAGELLGVGGAPLAVLTGRLAGTAAAAHALGRPVPPPAAVADLLRRRRRATAFAHTLATAHPVPPGWPGWLDDATVVCRCEEVRLGRLHEAIDVLGATDPRTAKLLTRTGMGWCQGRSCAEATSTLVAVRCGTAPEPGWNVRPVAVPLTLDALAAGDDDPS